MATPLRVGSRELKTRLGRYLKQVRAGRTLIVTDRGEPVAELRPLPAASPDASEAAAWERLYASGTVTRPSGRPLRPVRPVVSRGGSLSAAIREERDEGY